MVVWGAGCNSHVEHLEQWVGVKGERGSKEKKKSECWQKCDA